MTSFKKFSLWISHIKDRLRPPTSHDMKQIARFQRLMTSYGQEMVDHYHTKLALDALKEEHQKCSTSSLTTFRCLNIGTDSRYRAESMLPCPLCGATSLSDVRPWWRLGEYKTPDHAISPHQSMGS